MPTPHPASLFSTGLTVLTEITAHTTRNAAIRRGPDHAEAQHPRQRMLADEPGPLLVADWRRAVFVHFRVSATALRPRVPYDLDTHDGDAWVPSPLRRNHP